MQILWPTLVQYTQNFSDSPFWGNRPVLEWHVYYKGLDEEIDDVCISTTRLLRFFGRGRMYYNIGIGINWP